MTMKITQKAPPVILTDGAFQLNSRRRPTFPHSYPCSIIGPEGLNFRVRDGNGCDPLGIATEKSLATWPEGHLRRCVHPPHCDVLFSTSHSSDFTRLTAEPSCCVAYRYSIALWFRFVVSG